MEIAVVIPAYNEGERIATVLEKFPQLAGHTIQVIVVDDGSKDHTSKAAKSVDGVRVIRHRTNLGKGAAAKTGCDAAYKMGADLIVLMDADGQHRPEDLEKMLTPLLNPDNRHDLVLGVRAFSNKMPAAMRLGNYVMNGTARALFGITTRDTQSGYRAFRRDSYPKLRWLSHHYAMEMEMLILAAQNELKSTEVEIPTIYLDNYKGTTPLDGLRILATLFKWKFPWYLESSLSESSLL